MPTVGEASVDVVADGRRFRSTLQREMNRAVAGEEVTVPVDLDVRRARATLAQLGSDAEREGQRTGRSFSRGVNNNIDFSRAASSLAGLGRGLTIGTAFLVVGAQAAAATGQIVAFAAALAPAVGILATLPAATGVAAGGIATLAVALNGVGDAFSNAVSGDAEAFQESLEGLAPTAQAAAQALREITPEFSALRESVQGAFFTGFDQVLRDIAATLVGPLQSGMTAAATALAGLTQSLAGIATSGSGIAFIESSFAALSVLITNLQAPLAALFDAFLNVGTAVATAFGPQLGTGLADAITSFAAFLNTAAEGGQAVLWVNNALALFTRLGTIISGIGSIFASIGQAATATGGNILGVFGAAITAAANFLNTAQGMTLLQDIFTTLAALGQAVAPIFVALGGALTALLPGVTQLVGALGGAVAPIVTALGGAIASLLPTVTQLVTILGPALGTIITALGQGGQAGPPGDGHRRHRDGAGAPAAPGGPADRGAGVRLRSDPKWTRAYHHRAGGGICHAIRAAAAHYPIGRRGPEHHSARRL